jgi:hypothetical protein
MRALVTGATGFVGSRLCRLLDRPVVLTRDPEKARRVLGDAVETHRWEPQQGPPPADAFRGVDAVFNLAGESIGERRWNEAQKKRILDSRVAGTRNLIAAIAALKERPRVLVSASAVGYYGDRGDDVLDESAAPGTDFLAKVCVDWEAEAMRAREHGLRVVTVRGGLVLERSGGALKPLLLPFRLGAGGRIGHGRQWWPWIHLDDHTGLLLHAARMESVSGAMNSTAPNPVTNRDFTRALAAALHRPALFPAPVAALRVAIGEFADALVTSQRALPKAALAAGYAFRHPQLDEALKAILG